MSISTGGGRGDPAPERGEMMELEADHRRHAEIENAIRDLKYGVGLNHLPSGRFAANAAWLAVQVIAHNLARWTARLGLGEGIVTTSTLRRRYFALAGRLTHSARRWTLHLPMHWPWAGQLAAALARLRAIRSRPDARSQRRPGSEPRASTPAHASRTPAPVPSAPQSCAERRLLAPAPPGERRRTRRTLRQSGIPPPQASIGVFGVSLHPAGTPNRVVAAATHAARHG